MRRAAFRVRVGVAAIVALTRALALNTTRLATNPAAKDLLVDVRTNGQFASLRASPEFQKLVPPK